MRFTIRMYTIYRLCDAHYWRWFSIWSLANRTLRSVCKSHSRKPHSLDCLANICYHFVCQLKTYHSTINRFLYALYIDINAPLSASVTHLLIACIDLSRCVVSVFTIYGIFGQKHLRQTQYKCHLMAACVSTTRAEKAAQYTDLETRRTYLMRVYRWYEHHLCKVHASNGSDFRNCLAKGTCRCPWGISSVVVGNNIYFK